MVQNNSRSSLEAHTGRLSQLGGITPFTLAEGKAKGVSSLRVRTAAGLELWVLPDRGMDIFEATFLGKSLCWHSPTGVTHSAYYSNRGLEWLKSFFGGLLTTCGISNAGAPSEDAGESLGLHGSISNTPAEHVTWSEQWQGEGEQADCIFTITGKVREASVHGPNLLLERTLTTSLKSTSFTLRDVVENQGPKPSPLMLLYHFNFGFPLLTARSKVYAPSLQQEPATPHAAATAAHWSDFEAPIQGTDERVYFHHMRPDTKGQVTVVLVSDTDKPDFGVALTYDSAAMPEFVQWKMTGANHFVLGLEPGNCRSLGRAAERARGTLQTIAPGERREFNLKIDVLENAQRVADAIAATNLNT